MAFPLIDVIVPAAGIGKRMGSNIPKQYLKLHGATVLELTLRALLKSPYIANLIVVLQRDDPYFSALIPVDLQSRLIKTTGGDERSISVRQGLNAATTDLVMVHDAARPLIVASDIEKLIMAGKDYAGGAILASPMADTVKFAEGGFIERTVSRDHLFRAQTPQLFPRLSLIKAIDSAFAAGINLTDEASAMEAQGFKPKIVIGSADNFKLTSPADLIMAEAILAGRNAN